MQGDSMALGTTRTEHEIAGLVSDTQSSIRTREGESRLSYGDAC